MKNRIAALSLATLLAGAAFGAHETVVRPSDTGAALVNPDMGFVCYHMAGRMWAYGSELENGDTLDWFPGVSTVYFRLLWSELEPTEGDYRFDILDRVAQNWIAKGKKLAFRVICCNQTANACPDYVREAGAKGIWFRYRGHGSQKDFPERWEPVYDDPVFLEKYEKFMRAFADRYDGDPNVAFVDVGSFGMYGEGHTGGTSKLSKEETDRITRLHIKLHKRLLPKTLLVISDDVAGSGGQEAEAPLMRFAREQGVGYRDDSIFCMGPNTNNFAREGSWAHSHWARNFAPETPVVIEAGHWTMCSAAGRWLPERIVKCIEDHQASYFSIHGFPHAYYEAHREIMDAAQRRLGYRFQLREAKLPDEVLADEPVTIESTWVNAGVAILHPGARLTWSLVDAKGAVAWSVTDSNFDFRDLMPTLGGVERPKRLLTRCRFGCTVENPPHDPVITAARAAGCDPGSSYEMLKPGTYDLCVSVGSKQGTPEIALPLAGEIGSTRRYRLSKISVAPARRSNSSEKRTEVVAVYYPHWHPYPRGEKVVFGKGKSEWELVKSQKPRYPGHPVPIKPLMGYYDETDPAVVEKEIDLAADSGIDVFMYDWYFYGNESMMEEALDRGFLKARNNRRMKFALMWCYHDRYNKFGARPGVRGEVIAEREKTPDEFRRCFDAVLEKYLKSPLYWHKDGHPFFSIFNAQEFVQAMGGAEKARALLSEADAKAVSAGLPSIHWNAMQGYCYDEYAKAGFASCSAYNVTCGDVPGYWQNYGKGKQLCEYRDVVKAHLDFWKKREALEGISFIPTATRGWDCSARCHPDEPFPWKSGDYPYSGIVINNTPELFQQLLVEAKRFAETAPGRPGCVILNAWNEYTEGCWLVPDENIGTASLDAIRAVFGKRADAPVRWTDTDVVPKSWPVEDAAICNAGGRVAGVEPIWIEGAPWRGKPTRVFAWWGLPKGASEARKVPAMVLVHGGGGTAFASWVKRWTDRGYAAIAMDTCGGAPRGEGDGREHPRHSWSGPYGWGDRRGYEDEKLEDQWPYQAIAAIVRCHSFLRSRPEVDAERTGITGISWGGYLTTIAAGVDHRFKFAAPVYGCGWYDRNPFWSRNVVGEGERYLKWLANWDPRHYIGDTRCPVLRSNGDMDRYYTMEMTAKSMAALPKDAPATLVIRHAMPHAHPPAGDPAEITVWANYYLKGGYRPLAITSSELKNGVLSVAFAANDEKAKAAEAYYLADFAAKSERRNWTRIPVAADLAGGTVEVKLPAEAKIAYLNLLTDKGNVVTSRIHGLNNASEVVEIGF